MNTTHNIKSPNSNPNEIQNFSKLLRKLEMENVNIDEIRLLKNEHTYL